MKYFTDLLVDTAFERLASKMDGKASMERTSALMYFLAFDATIKNHSSPILDLAHESAEGTMNRRTMAQKFINLVTLAPSSISQLRQITELGKVTRGGNNPEKRLASNFYTTILKKASEKNGVSLYPSRPAPIFIIGEAGTGKKWGLSYYEAWEENLPKLLKDTRSGTPFTDLAIVVFRNSGLEDEINDLQEALRSLISVQYSLRLADFWNKRVKSEKIFAKHVGDPFQANKNKALSMDGSERADPAARKAELLEMSIDKLVDRTLYLEQVLNLNNIIY